jgi:prepilin-type processing-associated H-X9-DG protein
MHDSQWDNWISYGYNLTDWYFSDWFGIGYAGHRNTTVPSPAGELIFTESHDWWLWWWGANYEDGWDVLGQDTITPYKQVGCDGPTLYRHSEGVNIAFYDGHTAYMKKDKVWSKSAWDMGAPGMWSTFMDYPPSPSEQSRLPKP